LPQKLLRKGIISKERYGYAINEAKTEGIMLKDAIIKAYIVNLLMKEKNVLNILKSYVEKLKSLSEVEKFIAYNVCVFYPPPFDFFCIDQEGKKYLIEVKSSWLNEEPGKPSRRQLELVEKAKKLGIICALVKLRIRGSIKVRITLEEF